MLDERSKKVQESIENAKHVEAERMMAEENYNQIIREAHDEANKVLAGVKEQEKTLLTRAQTKAEAEASNILDKARVEIIRERDRTETEIRAYAAELVARGVEKVLRDKVHNRREDDLMREGLRV